jgi:hypothetical protein
MPGNASTSRDLVGGKTGVRRPSEQLGDDPGERLGAAALRRPVGDVGAGAMAARDVARIGEAAVDGADGVRVDPQRGSQLTHRRESRTRQ